MVEKVLESTKEEGPSAEVSKQELSDKKASRFQNSEKQTVSKDEKHSTLMIIEDSNSSVTNLQFNYSNMGKSQNLKKAL